MRILFICALFGGGRERRCAQLLNGLFGDERYDVHIISVSPQIEYLPKDILDGRLTIIESHEKAVYKKVYRQIISQFRPHIIHLWEEEPRMLFPLLPLKFQYHFKLIVGHLADGNFLPITSKQNIANQLSFCLASAVVSNTLFALRQKHAPLRKSHVIYNGFDFARLPENIKKEEKKKSLGITTQIIVSMCARFTTAKDYKTYVDVALAAKYAGMDVTFLAVGAGPEMENIKTYAQNKGASNVVFLGRRNDVEEILFVTDVSMLLTNAHSHAEGISNSILEAMASGIPIIATEGCGTMEIITSGVNGVLVPPSNDQEAFNALVSLLTNPELNGRLSQEAIHTVREKFTIDGMVEQYKRLYSQMP